ncbi:hypothetical protein TDB9533_04000 [Thalassocella blandensis]|nr:hypothetical protein TDB9533_04000 [Thalassocella blandensis]
MTLVLSRVVSCVMSMSVVLGWFLFEAAVFTTVSYSAARISLVKIKFFQMLLIGLLVTLVSLVPNIGWLCGIVVFVFLLHRATKDGVVDCMWVAFLAKPMTWVLLLLFTSPWTYIVNS